MRRAPVTTVLLLAALSSCGGDDSASPTEPPSTVPAGDSTRPPDEAATHLEPLDAPDCDDATELVAASLANGEEIRVLETRTGQWLCLVESVAEADGNPQPIGLDSSPAWVDAPAVTDAATLATQGWWYLFVLPADTPRGVTVVDESGTETVVAQSLDGDHLLLFDPTADAQAGPEGWITRTWRVLAPDGTPVTELMAEGPAAGTAPVSIQDVEACLREQGLTPQDPQPYPPEVSTSAWTACRDLHRAVLQGGAVAPEQVEPLSSFVACMAERGWIQLWLPDDVDVVAHDGASLACQPSG